MQEAKALHGLRVAILVDNGFEQIELTGPKKALEDAGAVTSIVSPQRNQVRGWNRDEKADVFPVDIRIGDAAPVMFDALLLPGGVQNPNSLRTNNKAKLFVQAFDIAERPIAAICHGPWMLVETGIARGHTLTSWPSLRTDILNAGGTWVNRAVVCDRLLVTGRKAADIPQFNVAMTKLFAESASRV